VKQFEDAYVPFTAMSFFISLAKFYAHNADMLNLE